MAGNDNWKNQPRVPGGQSGGGQWTENGSIRENAMLSERGQQDLRLFNIYANRWTGGVDASSRNVAYQLAMDNPELKKYLQHEFFGSNLPNQLKLYRVGGVDYYDESPVVSLFSTRDAAEGYQRRFDMDSIREFVVPMSQIIPTGTGAGEVWVDREWLE